MVTVAPRRTGGHRGILATEAQRHRGWEAIEHLKIGGGAKVYSLRLSQRIRAVGLRDGTILRLLSLHPDHDSTYERG